VSFFFFSHVVAAPSSLHITLRALSSRTIGCVQKRTKLAFSFSFVRTTHATAQQYISSTPA
ncbi:MAG: hypothetical protein WC763_06485, partial [Candidatus Paceibacterota bacterium]